ncbi:MAG: hypothetical protein QXP20_05350 [Candidatus Bathyarchaeia archaeon]
MGFWKPNTKQLAVCVIFGGASFALRALNIVIPIGWPFVIDARDIPGVIGAALSGPVGGLIIGILAGIPAKFPVVDIPCFASTYFLVGLLAPRFKWVSGFCVLLGYPFASVIVWQLGLIPSVYAAFVAIAPRMIVVPIQLMFLYIIFKRWSNVVDVIQR